MKKTSMEQKKSRDAIYAADKCLHGYVVELCKIHLHLFPTEDIIWLHYARSLSQLSRFSEAENAFDQAFTQSDKRDKPLHSIIFSSRGELNQRRGTYAEAEEWYLKAVETNPKVTGNRIFLGVLTFRRGDLKLAEQRLREAVECGGDEEDEAHYNLGGVLMAQERYEEAQQCYQRAIELCPNYKQAKLRLRDVKKILAAK